MFQNDAPEPEPGLDQGCVEKAKSLWATNSTELCVFTLEMQNIIPCGKTLLFLVIRQDSN